MGTRDHPGAFCTAPSNPEETDWFSRELIRATTSGDFLNCTFHNTQNADGHPFPPETPLPTAPSGGRQPLTTDLHTDASI